jgi:SAM-dependent methyltransferase
MARADTYRNRFSKAEKAEKYAARFETGARRGIDRREQTAVRKILAGLGTVQTILDVPSGAGRFLPTLGANGRHVIEVDSSFEMVALARKRARSKGVKATGFNGDAGRLALPDGAVDCVFCNRLLHHILSPAERIHFLREFHRLTRRHLIISFFNYHSFGPVRKVLKALKGRRPPYEGQPTQDEFIAEAAQAGFKVKEIVPIGPFWVAQKYFVLEKS